MMMIPFYIHVYRAKLREDAFKGGNRSTQILQKIIVQADEHNRELYLQSIRHNNQNINVICSLINNSNQKGYIPAIRTVLIET